MRKTALISTLVIVSALLVACGAAPKPPTPSPASLKPYLTWSASTKSATLTLDAGDLSFNGTANGKMVISIPKGWTVKVNFTDKGALNHSAAVVSSSTADTPAFPGASTPDPRDGTQPNGQAHFTFIASKVGHYRIACLVIGHEDAGMWATFTVTASGTPSIK